LEVRNLRKTNGHVVAIDDLSFTIDHGEVFARLGLNEAGMSTAVRSFIFGLLWLFSHMRPARERLAEASCGGMKEGAVDGHRT
jgi:ABC-type phosphonate transport system ATPase subunit